MASIHPNPDGTFDVRWREPGTGQKRRQRSRKVETKTAAKRLKADIESSLGHGSYDHRVVQAPLFEDWAEESMAATRHWAASTRDPALSRYKNHIAPAFIGRRIDTIGFADVDAWVSKLENKKLEPRTIHDIFCVLDGAIMERAVKADLISSNPCEGVRLPKIYHRERAFLDPAGDVPRLVKAVDLRYRAMILIATYQGLRWQEVAGLRVEDVDVLHRQIHIRGAITREAHVSVWRPQGKSASAIRTLPLFDILVPEVDAHLSRLGRNERYLFPAPDGGLLVAQNFLKRVWKPAVRDAGLADRDPAVTFHSLRHTCAAMLIEKGWHGHQLQRWFGHSDMRTTFKHYGHLLKGYGDEVGATFSGAEIAWITPTRDEEAVTA